MVLDDARDGAVYAALNLGHFGSKLHRSDDRGATWTEVGVPSYADLPAISRPPSPDGAPAAAEPPTLKMMWALEAGGADQPGRLWAGTLPGGLFRSDDRGATWTICRGLWDVPARAQVVRRRLRLARHPLGASSIRATRGACWPACRAAAPGPATTTARRGA